ncbi:hypothetical protein AAFZ62_19200, partial [Acinetobacter baumannii]|uniref:hypothetical protein n=1 Tax=Acinetobacter baumannii TaxID=470 RepID=UPI00313D399F
PLPEAAPFNSPSPEPFPELPPTSPPPSFPLSVTSLSLTVLVVVVGAVLIELEDELPMIEKELPEKLKTPVIGAVISTSSP